MIERPAPSGDLRFFTSGDGARLAYRVWEEERHHSVVLCLGGLSRNSRDFENIAKQLAATHTVIALDYRGRGESDWCADWRQYRPQVYLDDIRHLLAVENTHNVAVIGTSLGAFLAMALCLSQPSVIAGLVLNDAGPEVPSDSLAPIISYLAQPPQFRDYDEAATHLKTLMPSLGLPDDAAWRQFAHSTFRVSADGGGVEADWDPRIVKPLTDLAPDTTDLWALFGATLPFPTLLIQGGVSDVLLPETAEKMAAKHPRLDLVTVSNVGHAPSLTEPAVLATLPAFIETLRGAT